MVPFYCTMNSKIESNTTQQKKNRKKGLNIKSRFICEEFSTGKYESYNSDFMHASGKL